jgi:hypothetical protein
MKISAILIAFLISMSGFSMAQAATKSRKSSGSHSGRSRGHRKSSSHRSHSAKRKSGNVT